MFNRCLFGALLAAMLVLHPEAPAMSLEKPQTPSELGPAVGQVVPTFALRDVSGREQTLKSLAGPEGLVLVFFRSADW